MNQQFVWQEFITLPPEAQQQAAAFIAFLRSQHAARNQQVTLSNKLSEDPFVGLWRDREDLEDSQAWVRTVRKEEWGHF